MVTKFIGLNGSKSITIYGHVSNRLDTPLWSYDLIYHDMVRVVLYVYNLLPYIVTYYIAKYRTQLTPIGHKNKCKNYNRSAYCVIMTTTSSSFSIFRKHLGRDPN